MADTPARGHADASTDASDAADTDGPNGRGRGERAPSRDDDPSPASRAPARRARTNMTPANEAPNAERNVTMSENGGGTSESDEGSGPVLADRSGERERAPRGSGRATRGRGRGSRNGRENVPRDSRVPRDDDDEQPPWDD